MAKDPASETESTFAKFVREISEAATRVEEFEADPDRVMSEAGLSEEEKDIVRRGDEEEILNAIGQTPAHTAPVIRIMRIKIPRRRRPPTDPTSPE